MNVPVRFDDLAEMVGQMPQEERELRERLRSFRNAATAMIGNTECHTARALAWMANDFATGAIYAPAIPQSTLAELGKFCRRLMLTSMQAELINDEIGGGL